MLDPSPEMPTMGLEVRMDPLGHSPSERLTPDFATQVYILHEEEETALTKTGSYARRRRDSFVYQIG